MYRHEFAIQSPDHRGAILELVRLAAGAGDFSRVRGAYAFASDGGALTLTDALRELIPGWATATKQWLISIDFGITHPGALEYLMRLEGSEVRVPDAERLLASGLAPRRCFHPKTLLLDQGRAATPAALVVGSANLTVSGLQEAHEHATASIWTGTLRRGAEAELEAMHQESRRFDSVWADAETLDEAMLERYRRARRRAIRRGRRSDEDDTRPPKERERETVTRSFEKAVNLAKADCFWIEVAYVVENLGAGLPGNQIDMAKGSRVFFGVAPREVPRNTQLATITIRYGTREPVERHLRYGNNHMDKLDLPHPVTDGPASYEGHTLLLRREGPGRFRVELGDADDKSEWKRRSEEQGTAYEMRGGREYGVFIE